MLVDTPEKRDISKDEANDALQVEILNSLKEVNELLPSLGHGEAKRLLLANLSYPLETQDFTSEQEAIRKAYSASKRITDALIAMGVQVTLENMLKQQVDEMATEQGEENV